MTKQFDIELEASNYLLPLFNKVSMFEIESVFDRGFNIISGGHFIYLSNYYPRTLSAVGIQVKNFDLVSIIKYLEVGNRVKISPTQLIIYMRPQALVLPIKDINITDLSLLSIDEDDLIKSELIELLQAQDLLRKSGFNQLDTLKSLLEELTPNNQNLQAVSDNLIGAGLGLTPSGDDFIQGAVLMEVALGHPSRLKRHLEVSLNHKTTTRVSHAYYNALLAGYANLFWIELLKAVKAHRPDQLAPILNKIENYGHSSGKDMLLGALYYLEKFI